MLVASLTGLLCKDQFNWAPESQLAFDPLKKVMTQDHVLVSLDFLVHYTLEINASDVVIGVLLMHNHHSIAFYSKVFCPCLQQSSTYVKELYMITLVV